MKTSLRDVSSQVSIMTPEFLADVGANTLDEALRYSLNVENPGEYYDATTTNNTSLSLNPFLGPSRTRGLAVSTTTHDFFPTYLPIDTYNTERFTFASGPNAILFGSGNPAGSIDTLFKRAFHESSRYSAEFRFDTEDGWRAALDVNQPLWKNIVSIRATGLKQHGESFRKPNYEDAERGFVTLSVDPARWLSLRAWYETVDIKRQPVYNTVAKDRVTPWVEAGRPIYDNASGNPLPANSNDPSAPGYSPVFLPFTGNNATSRQVYVTGQSLGNVPLAYWTNTVITRGYDSIIQGADGFEHSIGDAAAFPVDANITGNGLRNQLDGDLWGVSVELNPFKNFYVELGYNEENYEQRFVEYGGTGATTLAVDANRYLPDGTTLNPNQGRYYVQGTLSSGAAWNQSRHARVTASYDLDFTRRDDWARWLGRLRVAGMLARDRNWRILQRAAPSVAGGGEVPYLRVYVDRQDDPSAEGVYHVNIPVNLFSDYTLPGTATAINSPFGPHAVYSAANGEATDIDTRLFAAQYYLLQDRIVLAYGKRADDSSGSLPVRLTDAGGNLISLIDRRDGFAHASDKKLKTDLKGVVVHPYKWLSFHYNESNSQNPSSTSAINLDGSAKPSGDGEGKDYGVSVHLLNGLVSLRVNKYESVLLDGLSSYRAGTGIGGINPFRDTVYNIEKSVLDAGAPQNPAFASYETAVAENASGTSFTGREVYDVSSDTRSEGYEAELVANPTPAWRISIGLAKTKASESNIAQDWFDFINARLPVWADYGNAVLHNNASQTVGGYINSNVISSWNYIRELEGRSNPALRKYRLNATMRYTFERGALKNLFVGGSYIWRSKMTLGYKTKTVRPEDMEFAYPGLVTGPLETIDISQPIYGKPLTEVDAFIGYSRKIFRGRIAWRIQANIRNLFDNQDRLAQRVDSAGVVQVYNLVAPRTLAVTNTFEF
ncbi:hypothetical protein AW736_16585 [Termitidicoccus mucosus]|uniref:TonB-dependent receptor-like beta-barrel domain-containing protein n=1 Tax=Termitidicoccus mucosus TaxID=1184151 RepID=A0A178IHC3_9BACT|nr:hypothetical protein AW736_16585 [Opitutaceae bacterium TSB47]